MKLNTSNNDLEIKEEKLFWYIKEEKLLFMQLCTK